MYENIIKILNDNLEKSQKHPSKFYEIFVKIVDGQFEDKESILFSTAVVIFQKSKKKFFR